LLLKNQIGKKSRRDEPVKQVKKFDPPQTLIIDDIQPATRYGSVMACASFIADGDTISDPTYHLLRAKTADYMAQNYSHTNIEGKTWGQDDFIMAFLPYPKLNKDRPETWFHKSGTLDVPFDAIKGGWPY